jgi:antitoxin CptB
MTTALAKLRWRCRRGMRELDALLEAFLESEGRGLSAAEMAAFEAILDLPDPELNGYLLGGHAPDDAAWAALIARIRAGYRPRT